MDRTTAKAISRIGKELAAAVEHGASEGSGLLGDHGALGNYSADYCIGLGVSLGILWECTMNKPTGAAHGLTLKDLIQWVRDTQKIDESINKGGLVF